MVIIACNGVIAVILGRMMISLLSSVKAPEPACTGGAEVTVPVKERLGGWMRMKILCVSSV